MQAQQVFRNLARCGEPVGAARKNRDAPQPQLRRKIRKRAQHALELRPCGIGRIGSGGRAPQHHREIADACKCERARDIRGGEPLHVGPVAPEVAETGEHDQPRRQPAPADRQHEDLAGCGADRAAARKITDRAMQHRVDGESCASRLDIGKRAQHQRRSLALRDAALDKGEFDRASLCTASRNRRRARGWVRDGDELTQEFTLLPFGEIAPGDLRGRRRAGIAFPQCWHTAAAWQHMRQRGGRVAFCEVDDGAADFRVAGKRAMALFDVPGRQPRPMRERERHGAVTRRTAAEFEALGAPLDAEHRVLAKACDQPEAFVGRRQGFDRTLCVREQVRGRIRSLGPLRRIEGIEVLAGSSRWQQLAESRKGRQHVVCDFIRVVQQVQHRQPPDQRIGSAQGLDRNECAAIGRAELDHPRNSFSALVRERCARDQPAHAVTDEYDVPAPLADHAFRQRASVGREIETPVVGMEYCVIARNTEHEAQPLIGEAQHAQWPETAAARQGEPGHAAERDFGRVEPLDVVGQALARAADGRAHDAGQDQRARPAAHAGCASGEPRQFLVGLEIR